MSARDVLADAMNIPRYWPDDVRFKRPDAYLAALSAAGYAVVPREPTREMLRAAVDADDKRTGNETCRHLYRAMVDSLNGATDRAIPAEVAALRAEVERLRGALSPLVAVIPDICNALDLDPDETSIRVRVDGGARDGEVLAERTLTDMLTAARAALAASEPQP